MDIKKSIESDTSGFLSRHIKLTKSIILCQENFCPHLDIWSQKKSSPQPLQIFLSNPPGLTHLVSRYLLGPQAPVDSLWIDPEVFGQLIDSEEIAHFCLHSGNLPKEVSDLIFSPKFLNDFNAKKGTNSDVPYPYTYFLKLSILSPNFEGILLL